MFHVWMGPINGGLAIGTIGLMVLISAMNGLSVAGMAIGALAALLAAGTKMKLTTIPDRERDTVEAEARKFWDEIAKESPLKATVVQIFKDYNAAMDKAGRPYRYG